MRFFEYESRQIVSKAGIDVSVHGFARRPPRRAGSRRDIGAPAVITSQVLSGGRRLWARVARALRHGGVLEVQCGGQSNFDRVREVIEVVAREAAPQLVGWSPWTFAGPEQTER